MIFLVNFAKLVRTTFLQNTTGRLLLIIAVSTALVMKGELAWETVNYYTKTMHQFEQKRNLLISTLQVKYMFQKQSFVGFKKFCKLYRKTSVFESLGLQIY